MEQRPMRFIDPLQQLFDYLVTHGIHDVLPAISLGCVGYWLTHRLPRLLRDVRTRAHIEPTLTTFVVHVSRYTLFIFFTIVILSRLGIETASLITVLGAAGLAIGLALQGSLSNFAAGVLMIVFRPFRVGDLVEVGGATGTSQDIQIFTTSYTRPATSVSWEQTILLRRAKLQTIRPMTSDVLT